MRGKMIFLALALIFLIPCATGAESAPSQLLELLQDSLIAPYEEALPLVQHDCATTENDFIRLTVREALYDGIALHTLIEIAPVREGEWIVIEDRAPTSPAPTKLPSYPGEPRIVTVESSFTRILRKGASVLLYQDSPGHNAPFATRTLAVQSGGTRLLLACPVQKSILSATPLLENANVEDFLHIASARLVRTPLSLYLETDCSVDLSRAPHIAPRLLPYLVYYSSSGVFGAPDDPYAHLDPACKATESPIGMYGNAAAALGKQPCPHCGEVDDTLIYSGAYCSFALADADGNLLPLRERTSCSTTLLPDSFDENSAAYLAVFYGGEQLAMLSVR